MIEECNGSLSRANGIVWNQGVDGVQPPLIADAILRRPAVALSNLFTGFPQPCSAFESPAADKFGSHVIAFIGDDKPWWSFGQSAIQNFRCKSECVYFVGGSVGAIKIGISKAPLERLAILQTGSPIPLAILALREGGRAAERDYHARFADHRLHGEWFAPHPDILAEIERLSPKAPAP